jgi:hypothetical protein
MASVPGGKVAGKVLKYSSKPIIIGENMSRVCKYADKIGGQVYKPWKNNPFDKGVAMRRNMSWIDSQMRNGREIIDIGPSFQRRIEKGGASAFYEMERARVKDYNNYSKVFTRKGNTGGVKGLDDGI